MCTFLKEKNGKGMMIFVVADIWNWYNMDMKYTNKSVEK